jgi:DNA-binding LacI/PurR family transcriptional regulator
MPTLPAVERLNGYPMKESSVRLRAPGLYDVARAAGVSHQTVSRVINDLPNVRPETRSRVLAAIAQIGYRRNTAARTLVTRRSGAIGVMTNRTALYGPTSILLNVEGAARESGYFVSLVSLPDSTDASVHSALNHFMDQSVEGIVVVGASADLVIAAGKAGSNIPVVVVTAPTALAKGMYVTSVDNRAGAMLAMSHLIDLGHRNIAHVRGPADSLEASVRARAYRSALRSAKLPPGAVFDGDWTAESGYHAGEQLLTGELPDAVFAGNDEMALGVLRAFNERGVRVPDDVSIVGFDDIAGAAYFSPPLTTVRQDFPELGARCMGLMLAAIRGEPPSKPQLVPPTLMKRGSTAARPT